MSVKYQVCQKIKNRFLIKINKTRSCWLWVGAIQGKGYGTFRLNKKTVQAHRLSFQIYNGNIPENKMVLHHCDVRNCVNPEHLFLGSNQDNMDDRNRKGRQSRGENRPNSILTDKCVIDILTSNLTQTELARKYRVRSNTINMIIHRKKWKHIEIPELVRKQK